MTVTAAKWTIDDYHQMIAAGVLVNRHVELLDGAIVEMPPEGPEHAQQSTDAADYLRALLGERVILRDAKPITLPDQDSEPEPDLAIVQPLRALYRTRHPEPDNIFWLIEYSNTSLKKDREAKAQIYAAAGIPEYWIVNLREQQPELIVMRAPVDGLYQSVVVYQTGAIAPLAFPGVQISIPRLLS